MGRSAWLDHAIAHEYLPFIQSLDDSQDDRQRLQDFTASMRDRWATQHGKPNLDQHQRLMDMTRRAIKDALGEEHWSLDVVGLSKHEYAEINDRKQGNVAKRNEQVQFIGDPDAIVARAVKLLSEPEWADIAAGLAVLTGRRSAELLSTAHFEVKSKWSVTFSGAVKRRGEKGLAFEIPTLTTAKRVVSAIEKLRRELPQAVDLPADQVNAKYGQAVARSCDRHFQDLVPTRAGKDNLYTHLFRSVYACIATFWYCPPNVDATEFKAAIQGHFQILDEENGELKRSLMASRHYSDFEIADQVIAQYNGKRKGIKLGHGGVMAIEMFSQSSLEQAKQALEALPPRRKLGQLRIFQNERDRWLKVMEQIAPDGTQPEKAHQLLEWIESRLNGAELPQVEQEKETQVESVEGLPQPVVEAQKPEGDDPLRQDIQQLVGAIQQLVAIQQAAISQPVPKRQSTTQRAESVKPQPKVEKPSNDSADSAKRSKSSTQNSQKRIDDWIQAIMDYNDQSDRRHDDKWAITISLLKSVGGSQPRIEKTLKERNDVQEHHQKHQIEPERHNLKHRGKRKVTDVISVA
ncbi:hypothetical protein LEP3755_62560 (plasmid) [Leptolyngbya sp. NIES-3755]|nr:hypothetical protein LEP3755_62560 [Leptolyngbya sp. NIES-3755]